MNVSDIVSIISLVVAVCALMYSMLSNTKKYELTYQYYTDVLAWHNQVIEVLTALKIYSSEKENKREFLIKLSALIESGRFYFPNIDLKDGYGKEKPVAYQGYRDRVLDCLVYEYKLFDRDDSGMYLEHAEIFQRLFTSYVFSFLNPKEFKKKIKRNTSVVMRNEMEVSEFLKKAPEAIYAFFEFGFGKIK